MLSNCISTHHFGPIYALLCITREQTIIATGSFYDEGKEVGYHGPKLELGKIPANLLAIKKEQPHCFVHTKEWQKYIHALWQRTQDHQWFRHPS